MKAVELDEIDRKILRVLSREGRTSNQRLAEQIGLSTTPCWNRVRALEKSGVIQGYVAVLDQAALGQPETVIVEITLDHHDEELLESFGQAIVALPEVMEVHVVTGEYDYLIKVAVAGTEAYEKFLRQSLYRIPGIRHTRSTFALRCLKRSYSVSP